MSIQTADTVFHKPTGEEWLVAFEKDGRLYWCGWPEGCADTDDCELLMKGTDRQRMALLGEMARMPGNDARKRYALKELDEIHAREDMALLQAEIATL